MVDRLETREEGDERVNYEKEEEGEGEEEGEEEEEDEEEEYVFLDLDDIYENGHLPENVPYLLSVSTILSDLHNLSYFF